MNEFNNQKFIKGTCLVSFLLLIVTLVFQMHIANTTALKGQDYQALYQQKKQLEKEIALLKYTDSNLSSLNYVESQAFSLGFEKMTGFVIPISSPTLASLNAQ